MSFPLGTPSALFRQSGQFEPEGIYLFPPLQGDCLLLMGWGDHPAYHAQFTYNGIALKGHTGMDIAATPGAQVLATDTGKVTEISVEVGGFGRYIKLEHRWGESIYAHLGEIPVETGQVVARAQPIALIEIGKRAYSPRLHFAIRITPYNRFDGWGGFVDPLPYLYSGEIVKPDEIEPDDPVPSHLPPVLVERPGMRRP